MSLKTGSNKNIHTVQPRHAWINIIEGRGAKAEKEEMTDRRDAERRWRDGGVEDFELTTELNDRRAKKGKKYITQQLFTVAALDPELHTLKVFFFYFLNLLPLFQHLLLNPISTFFIILSFTVCGENASEVEIGILALCSEPRLLRLPNGFSFNATSGSYNSDKLSNTVILISMVYQIN